jgi:imidazolonepropionase-like amidohydrolase
VLLRDGKIAAVGTSVNAPADALVIDGTGKYVTPGLIDVHSHIGDYPAPGVDANSDGNEATSPVTANVWAEHSVWPQDPQIPRALAERLTTMQVLPGSANLIGGRSVVLKLVPARTVQGMKFPGAKYGLKMACGENPKRVYQTRGPSTRMGNVAGYRAAWIQAEGYRRKWDAWNANHKGDAPTRDLGLETLAEVLRGNILVHNHCYRADEMVQMIDIAKEFGYSIRAFHHSVEAYKVAELLKANNIGAAEWADWGGFKMEANDSVKANLAITEAFGARAMIHSDSPLGAQRLNQEVAKAIRGARRRNHDHGRSGNSLDDDQSGSGAGTRRQDQDRLKWAKTPMWCSGPAIRSAYIQRLRKFGSTERCCTTAVTRPRCGALILSSAW